MELVHQNSARPQVSVIPGLEGLETQAEYWLETSATDSYSAHPLSPDMSDIAVSSFPPRGLIRPETRAIAQQPPDHIVAQQGRSLDSSRMNSLDAVTGGLVVKEENETEDGLFAVKLSPRSPEMTKSPFSFTAKDTAPWLKGTEQGND